MQQTQTLPADKGCCQPPGQYGSKLNQDQPEKRRKSANNRCQPPPKQQPLRQRQDVNLDPERGRSEHKDAAHSTSLEMDSIEQENKQHQHQDQARQYSPTRDSRPLVTRLKSIVVALVAKKKEHNLDNLETIINENALRILHQKELIFRQNNCLQLDQLCKMTQFSKRELKWLYSGWKVACTDGCGVSVDLFSGGETYGIINETQFQQIYAQFFPYGGDCSFYAKYVFQAMFGETLATNGGFITFADYAKALSKLLKGSIEEKVEFVFKLYDLDGDNVLTLDELSRIFYAIYRLLGDNVNLKHDQQTYEAKAESFYRKINPEQTEYITKEQFIDYCVKDSYIVDTIKMLEMSVCLSG